MGFTIKSRLGRGRTVESFAATLEVENERFDVVVKRPRAEFKQNVAFADALITWGENQRDVDVENVVAVLEAGRTEDGAYVLQEFIEGAPLSQVIHMLRRRKRTMSPGLALLVAEQVTTALVQLHKKQILHGGIDPGEVLVAYSGDVKLGDQWLKTLDQQLGRDLVAEKDPYVAPEVKTISSATKASDIYALGLVMLEMLIGTAVWTAEKMTVRGSVAALKDFTHVGQAQPLLTEDLVTLLEACLIPEPDDRVTASQALERIRALVSKHGIREERSALGEFVKALIPPPDSESAPTQMVDPELAEKIAAQHSARLAHFEGKSVPLDPDLEKKALTRAIPSLPKPEPTAPSPPKVPAAPSVSRSRAHSVKDVAKVAQRASLDFDNRGRLFMVIGLAAALLVVLLIGTAMLHGGRSRKIHLRATSVPAGAAVFVDGEVLGATPIDDDVEVSGSTVQLRFVLEGYKDHQVTIGTDAAELRYEAPLEKQ